MTRYILAILFSLFASSAWAQTNCVVPATNAALPQ